MVQKDIAQVISKILVVTLIRKRGKGHWIGNPDSGFDPGEAIPRDKSRIEKAIKDEYGVSTDEFLRIIDIIKPKIT